MQAALNHLSTQNVEVKSEDIERLSPLGFKHINFLGQYAFSLTEDIARGELRPFHKPEENEGESP